MEVSSLVECGVDYLTTTWPDEIRNTILASKSNVMDWAMSLETRGGKGQIVKPWASEGYVGFSCGAVQVGERPDGTILRLSSVSADRYLADGFTAGHNISRIDVALTIWGVLDQTSAIARHKDETIAHRLTLQSRPYKVRHILGEGEGDTLYCGSRTSKLFTRIYDKEREQSDEDKFKTAIRYEVECKEELARYVYEGCTNGAYSAANCVAVCRGLFARRGINPLHSGGLLTDCYPPSGLAVSSVEISLSWLEKQVAPTIRRLRAAGYLADVYAALGLPAPAELGD